MSFTPADKSLTKENILKLVDSYTLFKTYCKGFTGLDRMFKSEFRKEDEPSAHVIVWKGDLLYKDFGDRSYRVFDFISKKFGLSFRESLQKVNNDFDLKLGYQVEIEPGPKYTAKRSDIDISKYEKKGTVIEIKPRAWTENDKKYWSMYHIPLRLLEYHNIKSISHYRVSNEKKNALYAVSNHELAYSIDYYWHKEIFRRKLYFPTLKGNRRSDFVSNVDNTIVQGWTLLPKAGGRDLFVTKSYKDILVFNMLGYWAVAPNNEKSFLPDQVVEKLTKRWDNMYVWFDNDLTGIEGGRKFAEKFGMPFTCNPSDDPKDPSDYVKKYGLTAFDQLVNTFLNQCQSLSGKRNDISVRM